MEKKFCVSDREIQSILKQIAPLIMEETGCREEKIVPDACWRDDIGADSLDVAFVFVATEKKLGIDMEEGSGWQPQGTLRECCEDIACALRDQKPDYRPAVN